MEYLIYILFGLTNCLLVYILIQKQIKELHDMSLVYDLIRYRVECMNEYLEKNFDEIAKNYTVDDIIHFIGHGKMGVTIREHYNVIISGESIVDKFEGMWGIAAKAVDIDNITTSDMINNSRNIDWKG